MRARKNFGSELLKKNLYPYKIAFYLHHSLRPINVILMYRLLYGHTPKSIKLYVSNKYQILEFFSDLILLILLLEVHIILIFQTLEF